MKVYEAKINSDQTEGRGPMRTVAVFSNPEAAVARVKGEGVMGYGDGEVWETEVYTTVEEIDKHGRMTAGSVRIYGNRQTPDGKWGDGYLDLRDWTQDPEFDEYIRLKKKFEGK